jgi:hypothetical protein
LVQLSADGTPRNTVIFYISHVCLGNCSLIWPENSENRRSSSFRKHVVSSIDERYPTTASKVKLRSEIPLAVRRGATPARHSPYRRDQEYEKNHRGLSFENEDEDVGSFQRTSSITATERETFEKAYENLTGTQYIHSRAQKGSEDDSFAYSFPAEASSIEKTRGELDELLGSILETPEGEQEEIDDEDIPFDWESSHIERTKRIDKSRQDESKTRQSKAEKSQVNITTTKPSLQHLPGVTSAHLALHLDISTKLSRAPSSVEVWNILENNIFVLVKGLEDNAPSVIKMTATKRRGRPRKNPPSATPRERGARIHLASVIYGPLVLQAAQSFIYTHHEPEQAYSVLQDLKTLGPVSYIYGATTALYNELLWVRWKAFEDLLGVSELLTEMERGGVQYDEVTRTMLSSIVAGDQKEGSVGYAAMNGVLGKDALLRLKGWLGIVRKRLDEAAAAAERDDSDDQHKFEVEGDSPESMRA